MGAKAFKPTLKNSKAIMRFLNKPHEKIKSIHVAGSNGKGSTCSMISSILTEAGYKVGLFTSPHIKDFRERIRINGIQIPEQNVIDFIRKVKSTQLDFEPSFFEITFGMAMEYFVQEDCDICIIETGLGGRLDATNVIEPILSVITNISLEHTAMLGNTLEEIAFEKGGIIKPSTPVVIGKMNGRLYPIFEELAQNKKSSIHFSTSNMDESKYESPLIGEYQQENLRTVIKSCQIINQLGFKIDDKSIHNGLKNLSQNTGFFGRLQIVNHNPLTIFDVSHNPAGILASFEAIKNLNKGKLHIVYSTSADKDLTTILQLLPKKANYYFTEFSNSRSIKISDLKQESEKYFQKKCNFFTDAKNAFSEAQLHANHEDTIVVIGSFFLISDFF